MRAKWNSFRRRYPSRLTRKQKMIRNTLCVVLLLLLAYRLADCPPLTAMHAFRQAERRNLAGPSEVIARVPGEEVTAPAENIEQFAKRTVFGEINDWFLQDIEDTREFIVGEKDGAFWCFRWEDANTGNWLNQTRGELSYCEKTGEVTVMPVGRYFTDGRMHAAFVCIQTELEGAVYACVEIRVVRPYKKAGSSLKYYESWCSGEGEIHENGVFILAAFHSREPEETTQAEYEAMEGLLEVRVVLKNVAAEVIYDEMFMIS